VVKAAAHSRALSAPLRSVTSGHSAVLLRQDREDGSEADNGKSAPLSSPTSTGDVEHTEASFFGGVCSGLASQPTCASLPHLIL
jgi:hypothetical protein